MRCALPVVVLLAAATPTAASASTISGSSAAGWTLTGAPGVAGNTLVTYDPGTGLVRFYDPADPPTNVPAGCVNVTATGRSCPVTALKATVLAGDQDDTVLASIASGTPDFRFSFDGGLGNDTLTGSFNADTLDGGAGADALRGEAGNDVLIGGSGNDDIDGRSGDDILEGGTGTDSYQGGDGSDTITYKNGAGPVTATLGGAGPVGEALPLDVENLEGTPFDDVLTGSSAANTLGGLAGNDTISIRDSGPDTASCGDGTDTVNADSSDTSGADCETVDVPAEPVGPPVPLPTPTPTPDPTPTPTPTPDPTPTPGGGATGGGTTTGGTAGAGTSGGGSTLAPLGPGPSQPVQRPTNTSPSTPTNPDGSGTTATGAAVGPPVFTKDANLTAVDGTVSVQRAGQFVPFAGDIKIADGTVVDATNGRVKLTSIGKDGTLYVAEFTGGRFKLNLKTPDGATELILSGGSPSVCAKRSRAALRGAAEPRAAKKTKKKQAKKAKRRKVRGLFGSGKGNFRTRGRYASATVRGTIWVVTDYCEGTGVVVRQGRVATRDFVGRRTVTVAFKPGRPLTVGTFGSYFAPFGKITAKEKARRGV